MQENQPQKNEQYHIWHLISRKLSGDASQKELQELQDMLLDNPHIKYSVEVLTDLWNTTKRQNEA